ncbi:MAG: twin transmembrane helix small protein [Pikeienuella sp.]
MSDTMFYVAIGACIFVFLVMLFGVLTFARGGEFNRKYSNKIMRLRLAAQAVAIVVILLAVWLGRQGG